MNQNIDREFLENMGSAWVVGNSNPSVSEKQRTGKKQWFENFKSKWGDSEDAAKISIDKVDYVNNKTKATFICSTHGEFKATPGNIMSRGGCPNCVNKKNKITTEEFIQRAKKIHGGTYTYSKTKYEGMNKELIITCSVHGDFLLRAASHVHPMVSNKDKGYYSGCQKCSNSLRFKGPDPDALMNQIIKESKRKSKRMRFNSRSLPAIKSLLGELITTGVFMVNAKDINSSKSHQMNIATRFSSKLTSIAIDVITEPLAIDELFLESVSEETLKHIAFLGSKFKYAGDKGDCETTKRVDRLKEPAWKLVDACQERLSNGNKQVCVTRKDASAFL